MTSRTPRGTRASGRLSGWLANGAALLVAIAVAGLLAELAVLVFVGEQPKFPRHVVEAPWGLRYNEPGARYRHKSADGTWMFSINRQGMRADRDFAYEKPAGVRRIVSLGDSYTIGYEVDVDQTFSSVLERELRDAGIAVEVLNAGVSGFSNAEECLYLERELLRYQPDLVLLSFVGNDLVDNERSDLFRLEGERLIPSADRYVPMGALANWLNRSWVFNLASGYSNAFVFVKEELTRLANRRTVERNLANLGMGARADPGAAGSGEPSYGERLAAAILERSYRELRERGIPFVIQSIPTRLGSRQRALYDQFPAELFDAGRPGVALFPAREVLEPQLGRTLLYHRRSHVHWTAAAHEIAGVALARLVLRETDWR